ncbi:MAG: nuclear transport factor 2 family protein [Sphingobium sp.]
MGIAAQNNEAVRNLIARQKFRTDDRDADGVAQCWAADARLELQFGDKPPIVREGREAIVAFAQEGWARTAHPHVHLITTLEIIERDDGKIGAESYCLYLSVEQRTPEGYGRYTDIFVREADGEWRIQSRNVRINAVF